MKKWIISLAFILSALGIPVLAQADWCTSSGTFCYGPSFIMPGTGVFFDQGEDGEDRPDFFDDGELTAGMDLVGFDFYLPRRDNAAQLGFTAAFGTQAAGGSNGVGAAFMVTFGPYVQFGDLFRLGGGWTIGVSATEALRHHSDSAYFVRLSFPTTLGTAIENLITR